MNALVGELHISWVPPTWFLRNAIFEGTKLHAMGGLCGFYQSFIINFVCEKEVLQNGENSRLKKLYRGSTLSTIFGIWKKPYYVKFVLVSTT